jgi:phosphatidylinositol alpha-1,6-mannosyltransferase
MQRVASELHEALSRRPDLEYASILLRSTWRATGVRTPPFLIKTLFDLRRRVRGSEVDVILFSSMVTASLAVPLKTFFKRHGVATAAIVHGLDVTTPVRIYQRFVPRVFDALDVVLPVSRATGQACLERGLAESKLQVVPNGVNPDRFKLEVPAEWARDRLARTLGMTRLPSDSFLLCSVGRQVERKGFVWFVENVMPRLPKNVHYWLGGEGPEGERIIEAANRLGLSGRVRLLGRLSDRMLELLYRGSNLFVMPNVPVPGDMEGFGVVMLEAGMCGLPTVGARLEGIKDVIAEGKNGYLAASEDTDSFVEQILRYYRDHSRSRASKIRAARHTTRNFGWPSVAYRYASTLLGIALDKRLEGAPHLGREPVLRVGR